MRLILVLAITFLILGCKNDFEPSWAKEAAPEKFVAEFETTKGSFTIGVTRKYSPKAVDRFYQLVKNGYFENGIFYRVVDDYVAQFGNTDVATMENWRQFKIPDEPVVLQNKRGTISFARHGKESRDLEVFINLRDNETLDTINIDGVVGYPAFGQVINGMDVVDKLYSKYGERTMSDPDLYTDRAGFLKSFPELDRITKATIIEE